MLGALVLAFVLWFFVSLAVAVVNVRSSAHDMRHDLQAFRTALARHQEKAAKIWLARAEHSLGDARGSSNGVAVRIAGHVPGTSGQVSDLHHLLSAAQLITTAGHQAITTYDELFGAGGHIVHNERFNLPAMAHAAVGLNNIEATLGQAREQLRKVSHGLPLINVDGTRDAAMRQVATFTARLASLDRVLQVLPAAVGEPTPRNYLLVAFNPAESRASGGAPLSLAELQLNRGVFSVGRQGQTSVVTDRNTHVTWVPVPTDGWKTQHGKGPISDRLGNANFNPDFTIASAEILRAYKAQFGTQLDGVIALDPVALADILRFTGGVKVAGYGKLTAANVTTKLVGTAYRDIPDPAVRHRYNDYLMSFLFHRLLRNNVTGQVAALTHAAKGRHFDMYFLDPTLESLVVEHGLSGQLPRKSEDLLATYTQNTNGSKVDIYQQRLTQVTVRLQKDGSAVVDRRETITNGAILQPGTDVRHGDLTAWSGLYVAEYLPAKSRLIAMTINGPHTAKKSQFSDNGYRVLSFGTLLAPGQSITVDVKYQLKRVAYRTHKMLYYTLALPVQPLVNPPALRLTVIPPAGFVLGRTDKKFGWVETNGSATLSKQWATDLHIAVRASRS